MIISPFPVQCSWCDRTKDPSAKHPDITLCPACDIPPPPGGPQVNTRKDEHRPYRGPLT